METKKISKSDRHNDLLGRERGEAKASSLYRCLPKGSYRGAVVFPSRYVGEGAPLLCASARTTRLLSRSACRYDSVFPSVCVPSRSAGSRLLWWKLCLLVVGVTFMLTACSTLRPPYKRCGWLAAETLDIPPTVDAMLRRRGFHPIDPQEARHPTRVWWCVRPVNIPGGRMAARVGWFHEWILAPGLESGADFQGADSVRGTWPKSPLALLRPLHRNEHRGSALQAGTYCREVRDVTPQAIQEAVHKTPRAGWLPFPLHNCHTWVQKVSRQARQNPLP